MLYQNYSFEQSQNQIFSVLKDLQIAKLLYKANIRKGCGLSALEMFQRLVMLVFHGKNLFRSLESKHNDHAASKSTYYRFLSNPSFNWKKFLLLLAIRVTTALRKLGMEFQTRSYDSAVAHTAIVFARYRFLEWLRRQENDPKTYGGLFFALCEDVQDMELSDALWSLMSLFMETINGYGTEDTETIKSKVSNWIASQSRYIKGLFQNLCWES